VNGVIFVIGGAFGVRLLGILLANFYSAGGAKEISRWWSGAQPPETAPQDKAP